MGYNLPTTTLSPIGTYGLTSSQDGGVASHFTDVMSMHAATYPHYGATVDVYGNAVATKSLPYARSVDYSYRHHPAEYSGYLYEVR